MEASGQFDCFFLACAEASVVFSDDCWSPITPFNGQTLKIGHFLHPATIASGQSVMSDPFCQLEWHHPQWAIKA